MSPGDISLKLDSLSRALIGNDIISPWEAGDLCRIETLRKELALSHREVQHIEYGALNNESPQMTAAIKQGRSVTMSISQSSMVSSVDEEMGRDLYRMVSAFAPSRILEIGTCIGLSALFMGMSARRVRRDFRLITLEGGVNLAAIAAENFARFRFTPRQAEIKIGQHASTISQAIDSLKPIEFAFVDGSHIEEEVLDQYEQIVEASAEASIILLDDISWSNGMRNAWSSIVAKPAGVSCVVDCARFGICVVDKYHKQAPMMLTRAQL